MDNKTLLQKYIELEANNLFIASDNYLMSVPKPGYEDAWKEARERLDGLERIRMFLDIQESQNETAPALNQQERLEPKGLVGDQIKSFHLTPASGEGSHTGKEEFCIRHNRKPV